MLLWIRGGLSPQEIRERLLDKESEFQKKMVEYLESVHAGEFATGTKEDVRDAVNKASVRPDYSDPTLTLPEQPPVPCAGKCPADCGRCAATKSWWDKYPYTVDDLLFRSNMHNCTGHKRGEMYKGKVAEYSGCKANKWGKCRARFPRQVFESTMIDPDTGALNMKKGEPDMNTFTPLVTYLFRSNTDVTSLLSGTAIKAVVAYISDYITKPSLKTYSIFETIRGVFRKNSEMLGGTLERREKARKLITQIVNALTRKSEMGGPMVCLYLLGFPDHYTNHKFVPFYWESFVREARRPWAGELETENDTLVLNKQKGRLVGLTNVHDYVYRPAEYRDMNLYDWVSRYERKRRPKEPKQVYVGFEDDCEPEEDELNIVGEEDTGAAAAADDTKPFGGDDFRQGDKKWSVEAFAQEDPGDDLESDDNDNDELDTGFDDPADGRRSKDTKDTFMRGHPLFQTHLARCAKEVHARVPNFLGAPLPRVDRGDRDYYCSTMLTFFKPWRSGRELRHDGESWESAFTRYPFSDTQKTTMNHFNVKYECLDARDDYSAQMKLGQVSGGFFTQWDAGESHDIDHESEDAVSGADLLFNEDLANAQDQLGPSSTARERRRAEIERILESSGWTGPSHNGLPEISLDPVLPEVQRSSKQWQQAVQNKRDEVNANRLKDMPEPKGVSQQHGPAFEGVKVVDKNYLTKDFKAASDAAQSHIEETVKEFALNKEQERAFRIVANHTTCQDDKR
ncbi:hypothetical protein PLICRDRAFT_682664 [Plicaturopsis crispa FD-325 SS-3]|uniref:Unplaced genomic scaffold PLICRscaffold_46, whole genome shotgun sequence n=1 Tax=Plicaturopsis crispa FD-325 SS-3 TaxID=944288 RepID=A0A0C9SPR1_PLICR|nr:hypothetical protein PLICRDRAFT_682664 [Plicaturopsis crispa FD-325 SS-3]